MSQRRFAQYCSCSLLDIRPHLVTRRSDWERHLRVLEQDILDQNFNFDGAVNIDPDVTTTDQRQPPYNSDNDTSDEDNIDMTNQLGDGPSSRSNDNTSDEEELEMDHHASHRGEMARTQHSSDPMTSDGEDIDLPEMDVNDSAENTSEDEQMMDPDERNDSDHDTSGSEAQDVQDDEGTVEMDLGVGGGRLEFSDLPMYDRSDADPDDNSAESVESGENRKKNIGSYNGYDHTGVYHMDSSPPQIPQHIKFKDDLQIPQLFNEEEPDPDTIPADQIQALSIDERLPVDMESSDTQEFTGPGDDRVGQMRRGFVDDVPSSCSESLEDPESEVEELIEETSSSSESEKPFPYGSTTTELSKEATVSLSIHDLKISHRVSRAASTDYTTLLKGYADLGDKSCWDYRTTRKWVEEKTGVKSEAIDCCRNSCMSYALYPEKGSCDYCGFDRWKEGTNTPHMYYEYIPITHRLRLWYADRKRADTMISYRSKVETETDLTDYWQSEHYMKLKSKGLFQHLTDMGFLLSTDGVQVFKARAKFSIWPMVLKCLNLPPEIRTKRQNMLCVGFIPGPNNPKNIDSFLYPLVKEFEALHNGIKTLNGNIPTELPLPDRQFILRGYLCLIGADMIGREKLMKVTGNRSYCYCEYCMIRGIWNRGIYCPLMAPVDTPRTAINRKGSGYPWVSWDKNDLPMRRDPEFRRVATQIARKGGTSKQASKYGIKGLSILSRLPSIDFPCSFPPDSMHLWFENIVPDMVKHWRGKYFLEQEPAADDHEEGSNRSTDDDVGSDEDDADNESSSDEDSSGRSRNNTRRARGRPRRNTRESRTNRRQNTRPRPRADAKVIQTKDPYNISLKNWEIISRDIADSAKTIPLLFGPKLRNFIEYINMLTASEWQLFTILLAPVYMKDVLPKEDYDNFIGLVEAIQISCGYQSLKEEDIQKMEDKINKFHEYYEKRYYRQEWSRLKVCLPVFHQIIHVPQALRWAGPMHVYSQWGMERLCGTIARMAKSKASTNRNMAITLCMIEQRNALLYVLDDDAFGRPESSDEDEDGGIKMFNFLSKRLRTSRPHDPPKIPRVQLTDTMTLCGPSKYRRLTTHERICLQEFVLNENITGNRPNIENADDDLALEAEFEADSYDIPTHCRVFRSAIFDTMRRGDEYVFTATSSSNRRGNQTRSSSFIKFGERNFGEVMFFFSVEIQDGTLASRFLGPRNIVDPSVAIKFAVRDKERGQPRYINSNKEMLLAYIRHFPTVRDGKLLYRGGKGVLKVIFARDINELIGLLKNAKREYIVRRRTALFD